jgi:hypothetical protein
MFASFHRISSAVTLLVVGGVWLLLLGGDWFMRFAWFRWQEHVMTPSFLGERGSFPPLGVFTNPPVRGGDLTTLMGDRRRSESYKEWKVWATNWSDEFGFRNRPPSHGQHYDVVVVGDSFMLAGPRMEDTFAGMLETHTGARVYNYAIDGRGPLWPMAQFLAAKRFKTHPPSVVVWGLLERDLAGLAFSADVAALLQEHGRVPIRWNRLMPNTLKHELPDTAATAQIAARIWNRLTNFRKQSSENTVLEATDGSMLFYKPAARLLETGVAADVISNAAYTVAQVAERCRRRGMPLVVVLIPDKERVYAERVPGVRQVAPSALPRLEATLQASGVSVINLLPVLREHSSRGELLYWRDDTHWNPRGVQWAVQMLVRHWPSALVSRGSGDAHYAVQ